jgi:prolyl oligopeptidase
MWPFEDRPLTHSLTKTYNYERYGTPWRRGNRWYYSYNEGLKAQNVHYAIENDAIDSKEQGTVFFDPNTLSEDGTLSVHLPFRTLMYS